MLCSTWSDVSGWFSAADARAYQSLVRNIRSGVIVEVGVWKGRSLFSILDICRHNDNIVYAVDDWRPDQRDPGYAEAAERDIETVFRANMRALGHAAAVTVIRERSTRAASKFRDRSVDLLFLDADHEHDAVAQEMRVWLPKLIRNGVISGHDYRTRTGVRSAVDELFGDRVALPSDNVWAVKLT